MFNIIKNNYIWFLSVTTLVEQFACSFPKVFGKVSIIEYSGLFNFIELSLILTLLICFICSCCNWLFKGGEIVDWTWLYKNKIKLNLKQMMKFNLAYFLVLIIRAYKLI